MVSLCIDICLVECYTLVMEIEIIAIRKRLKLTQKELAEKLGVDAITVSRWERLKQRPSQLAKRGLARLSKGIKEE